MIGKRALFLHAYQLLGRMAVLMAALAATQSVAGQENQAEQATKANASQEAADSSQADVNAASGQIILVVGASGTDEYGQEFSSWADQWKEVARESETPITLIGLAGSGDGDDKQLLKDAIASSAAESATPLWVVLLGHGTLTRGAAKFNLRGPDVSVDELSTWLQSHSRPVVIVNCASSSGPFVNRLSGKNRIVVTATKSGTERNYARFGKYFAQAIAAPDADLDHDDEVSVQEAFLRASAGVRDFYEQAGRIATEHALLDDNGDSKGTPASMFRGTRAIAKAKDGSELDGKRASRLTLAPASSRLPFTREELNSRDSLEEQLDELRKRKPEMAPEAHSRELEKTLIELARIYRAAEARAKSQ